ncbi:MAG: deaminase [Aurantimicrobium sp.]
MPTQQETDETYMGVALLHAKLSKGKRLKVGACLVLESGVMIGGVNGLPSALGNELEYTDNKGNLVSKLEVIHAEQACLNKSTLEGVSTKGAKMYVSHAPCRHCCSNMIASGISEIIWKEPYRDTSGLDLLKQAGVKYRQIQL